MVSGVEVLAGYVDYVCANQMLRLELLSMARESKLEVEGCSILWLHVHGENKGLKEIVTNLDVLIMAISMDSSRETHVCIRTTSVCGHHECGPSGSSEQVAGANSNNEQMKALGVGRNAEEIEDS